MCIALAAYSCRDSPGLGRRVPPLPCSLLSLFRGTGAIIPGGCPDDVGNSGGGEVGQGVGSYRIFPLPFRGRPEARDSGRGAERSDGGRGGV